MKSRLASRCARSMKSSPKSSVRYNPSREGPGAFVSAPAIHCRTAFMIANLMFSILNHAAKKGVTAAHGEVESKLAARQPGVKGETYAYWYLRRHGYTPVARKYTVAGTKGEIDIVAYDGAVL